MSKTILITGATGFVGKALMQRLVADQSGHRYRVLVRDKSKLSVLSTAFDVQQGDLTKPDTYQTALDGVDTIVHLAAQTGKASAADHDRLNRQATAELIKASEAAGIGHFIFVSTIAAGYPDKAFYPYAKAKVDSERDLEKSSLSYSILRPTLVLGRGSPIWGSLAMLAGLPVVPLPARGGPVEVQPVDVDDVSRAIVCLLERECGQNEILELGGPERLTMRKLLEQIAEHKSGKTPKVLPLPLRLIQWPLALMEPVLRPLMPVTAGQFAVFGNPSPATPNWLTTKLAPKMIGLRDMMDRSSEPEDPSGDAGPKGPVVPTNREAAAKEATQLARHMSAHRPGPVLIEHYVTALTRLDLVDEGSRFNQLTLSLARRGGLALRLADAYCGFFNRRGILRRRQVLLAALLEHEPAAHRAFDDAFSEGPASAFVHLAMTGIASGIFTLAGLLTMLPARVFYAVRGQ